MSLLVYRRVSDRRRTSTLLSWQACQSGSRLLVCLQGAPSILAVATRILPSGCPSSLFGVGSEGGGLEASCWSGCGDTGELYNPLKCALRGRRALEPSVGRGEDGTRLLRGDSFAWLSWVATHRFPALCPSSLFGVGRDGGGQGTFCWSSCMGAVATGSFGMLGGKVLGMLGVNLNERLK